MTQPNLAALARQGNPRAIAALVNQHLQPQGIQGRVTVKAGNLHLLLESEAVPDRATQLAQITHLFLDHQIHAFETVMVYGRKQGDKQPAWQDKVDLAGDVHTVFDAEEPDLSSTAKSSATPTSVAPSPSPTPSTSEADTLLQHDVEATHGVEATAASDEAAVDDFSDLAHREPFGSSSDTNGSEAGPTSTAIPADFAAFDLGSRGDRTDGFEELEDNDTGDVEADLDAMAEDAESEDDADAIAATAQPWYRRNLGLMLGGLVLVVLAVLGMRFWLNQQSAPVETPLPAESPGQSPVASPASPPASPVADPFRAAVNRATSAAQLTQTAQTRQEWEAVAAQWREAIALMQAVPADHPNYATAQDRAGVYQKNLAYAEQAAASRPK